jgi:hypothetical protein
MRAPIQEALPPEALLDACSPPIRELAERLRAIVRRGAPGSIERVRAGWRLIGYDVPVGRRTAYFAFVAPEPGHVHLGFERGVLMDDPNQVLVGRGVTRQVRWLTFRPGDEVDEDVVLPLVREAARVATLSRAQRLAMALDSSG